MALITIPTFTIPDWHYGGSTATLKLTSSNDWTDAAGQAHSQGSPGSQNGFSQDIVCTVSGTNVIVPQFQTTSTTDSRQPLTLITGVLFDEKRVARWHLFDDFTIPTTTPLTWDALQTLNRRSRALPSPASVYLDRQGILDLFNTLLQARITDPFTGDGITSVFTLSHTPVTGSELVFAGNVQLNRASSGDNTYQLSGTSLTINTPPQLNDKILIVYYANSGLVNTPGIALQLQESSGPSVLTIASWPTGTYAFRGLGSSIIGQQLPEIDIRSYASLAAAVSAIGATPSTLIISTAITATANMTIPSTLGMRFVGSGKITISNGVTFTHAGPLIGERRQIFANALAGQGTVSFAGNRFIAEVFPEWFGAAGDASTDNAGPFMAAFEAANTGGGILVTLPAGTFHVNSTMNSYGSASLRGAGRSTVIKNATGTHGEIRCQPQVDGVSRMATATITAGGVLSLTLSNVTGLAIGDRVELFLGTDPTDAGLPFVWMYNTITNIAGSVVSFLIGVPESITGTSHIVKKVLRPAENIEISNCAFTTQGAANIARYSLIRLTECRNVRVSNINSYDQTQATILFDIGENITLENITTTNILKYASDLSTGGFLAGWTVRNIHIRNVSVDPVDNIAFSFEGQCRGVYVDGVKVVLTSTYTTFASIFFLSAGCSTTSLRNAVFVNPSGTTVTISGFDYSENLTAIGSNINIDLSNHHGRISWNGITAYERKTFSLMFPIRPSTSKQIALPAGWLADLRVYVSSKTGITQFGVQADGASAENLSLAQLVNGQTVRIAFSTLSYRVGTGFNDTTNYAKSFFYNTDGSVPTGSYGVISGEFFMPLADDKVNNQRQDTSQLVKTAELDLAAFTFATLPAGVPNGTVIFVSDGTAGSPLAGSGTGCLAVRQNGAWKGL